MYKFWPKRNWNCAYLGLWFPKYTFLKEKEGCPLRPKIIYRYFCKFRLKRAWNYACFACKIQNFLRQGGAAPLQTPKSYYTCMKFYRKGTLIVHLQFPQIRILLWKGGLPPCDHQRSCKFRLKRAWNYAYLARKMQNFLKQGVLPPCNSQNHICLCINFDRKGTEIVNLWFPLIHIFL